MSPPHPIALARKYRPRTFGSVAVQSHVSNTLKGAIARGRVAHGYLLCGPRGTGKTTLARVLAMALNCERLSEERAAAAAGGRAGDETGLSREAGEPCGQCVSCERIWSGSASLDVVEIDAASNRGVDDARDLRERAMYAPSGDDRYKVYIVDEAHMLTREAWNALLKVLEEPPPRVVFVFATTEPQKIAQTAAPVLSRVQRFDLKRIGPADIRERLAAVLAAEGVPAEPEALGMIARAADGGLRDALSLTDQVLSLGDGAVTAERVREALGLVPEDEFLAMLDLVAERRAGDVFAAVARLADHGIDFGAFLTGLADMVRAQLAVSLGGAAPDVSERLRRALEERKDRVAPGDLLRMLHLVTELEPRFRKSGQQQILLETLLVRFALLDRSVAIEDLLRTLGEGSASGTSGGPTGPTGGAGGGSGGGGGRRASPGFSAPRVAPDGNLAPRAWGETAGTVAQSRPALVRPRETEVIPLRPPAAPPEPPAPVVMAAPSASPAPAEIPTIAAVAERWGEVVAGLRADGRAMLATVVEQAEPAAVTGAGALMVRLPDEAAAQALEGGRETIAAALRALFPGIQRLTIRPPPSSASSAGTGARRMTTETINAERVAVLRKRDPMLDAAVEALDLELAD